MTERDQDEDSATPELERLPEDTEESFNPERLRITTTVDQMGPDEPLTVAGTQSMDAISLEQIPVLEYEFVRLLGRGGLGEVWEARQLSLGRSVALKRLKSETYKKVSRNESVKVMLSQGMQAEAVTTAILDHPNIVPVHDFSRDHDGRPMISMKLVRGEPWDIIMKRDWDRLSSAEFLAKHIPILVGMSQAVAFAHSRGIIHRDLKPAQVMVGEFDEVLLMDWGLALAYDEHRVANFGSSDYTCLMPTTDTASNPAGTVAYMAPEQTETDPKKLGPWTDVYLLGATLYQVLTKRVPHPGSRIEAYKHARGGRIFPAEIAAPDRSLPDELLRLMHEAMEPDYRRRKITASDFVIRLKAWLTRSNLRIEGLALREQVTRQMRRLTDDSDYRDFTEQLVLLRRLQYLLPDDPSVSELESDLAARFAVVAARRGDIGLARLQASLVPDDRRRDVVSAEIERRARIESVQQRQRRVFLSGFIILVVVALTSTAYFTSLVYAQQKEQLKANAEREQAGRTERYMRRQLDALSTLNSLVRGTTPLASYEAEALTHIRQGLEAPEMMEVNLVAMPTDGGASKAGPGVWMRELTGLPKAMLLVQPSSKTGSSDQPKITELDLKFLQTASDILGVGRQFRNTAKP